MSDTEQASPAIAKAQEFHEKAVECARAQVALEGARKNERQDPDAVFPAAQAWRQAEGAVQEAARNLVAAHVEALRT